MATVWLDVFCFGGRFFLLLFVADKKYGGGMNASRPRTGRASSHPSSGLFVQLIEVSTIVSLLTSRDGYHSLKSPINKKIFDYIPVISITPYRIAVKEASDTRPGWTRGQVDRLLPLCYQGYLHTFFNSKYF